jgi:hypothetical protein
VQKPSSSDGLLSSADGRIVKGQFVRPIDDLLTLQTEIARELVEALGIRRGAWCRRRRHQDPAAYRYAKGDNTQRRSRVTPERS